MREELGPLLRLSAPVIVAEIGWMAMGLVDTIIVGPLGPAAIGATGMSSAIFIAIAVFGMGMMLGLDALVSQSLGAGRLDDCERWLQHGVILALGVAPLLMVVAYAGFSTIGSWGLHPAVRALAGPYLRVITLGTLPLLVYASFRRYLQGIHIVRPVMYALISANIINAAGNWVLVYGRFGAPAMGIVGSAWATNMARTYLALFLWIAIAREHRRRRTVQPRVRFAYESRRLRELVRLGLPAAAQVTLEVGVFAAASVLAGRLDPVSLGSHQIAINIISLAFMIPLGLSSAAAVRVGHAMGAGDPRRAVQAGWAAFATGGVIMLGIATVLLTCAAPMLRIFTADPAVIAVGVHLLAIAAAFQVFDGTQAVAIGVLRGIGDTRTPMVANIIGHWVLALPAAYVLCFWLGWGIIGLWVGLSIGLIFVAIALTITWTRKSRLLDRRYRVRLQADL